MAVTVISQPQGYKLDATPVYARAGVNVGDLLINKVAHGLTTGNYVYVESDVDSYNGFFYVNVFDSDNFKLQYNSLEFAPYVKEIYLYYYVSVLDHGWQCVHLPIVYELVSDLYPVNSVDTIITISPYGDVNGYFAVTHSALTGADELFALDYVKLADGRILQVVEIVSSTITVLNFDGSGTISTMQKVRNNYHVLVNVYAGLPTGHHWESYKPYELATTLRFIPDSSNQIKFSISEILKGYIATRNNLTLDTLPNNIDFMTAFYIEFTEAYDVSDGTEITVFEDEFEEDDFEGYAVNAMLPFKNLYSGWMSNYLLSDTSPKALFLTTFDVPSLFENYFFDISILVKEGLPQLYIKKVWYFEDGTISHTEEDEIEDFDEGVYRVELEAQCSRSYEEVTTYINSEWESNVEGWYQLAPATDNWAWGNSPDYFGDGTGYVAKPQEAFEFTQFNHTISLVAGQVVRFQTEFGGLDDGEEYNLQVYVIESLLFSNQIGNYSYTKNTGLGDNTLVVDEEITIPEGDTNVYIGVYFILSGGSGTGNVVYVNYFRITSSETVTKSINKVIISITDGGSTVYTEEKTINVICECGDTFVNDDLRITEDSVLRQIE